MIFPVLMTKFHLSSIAANYTWEDTVHWKVRDENTFYEQVKKKASETMVILSPDIYLDGI